MNSDQIKVKNVDKKKKRTISVDKVLDKENRNFDYFFLFSLISLLLINDFNDFLLR